jgi:hypothetical protein
MSRLAQVSLSALLFTLGAVGPRSDPGSWDVMFKQPFRPDVGVLFIAIRL